MGISQSTCGVALPELSDAAVRRVMSNTSSVYINFTTDLESDTDLQGLNGRKYLNDSGKSFHSSPSIELPVDPQSYDTSPWATLDNTSQRYDCSVPVRFGWTHSFDGHEFDKEFDHTTDSSKPYSMSFDRRYPSTRGSEAPPTSTTNGTNDTELILENTVTLLPGRNLSSDKALRWRLQLPNGLWRVRVVVMGGPNNENVVNNNKRNTSSPVWLCLHTAINGGNSKASANPHCPSDTLGSATLQLLPPQEAESTTNQTSVRKRSRSRARSRSNSVQIQNSPNSSSLSNASSAKSCPAPFLLKPGQVADGTCVVQVFSNYIALSCNNGTSDASSAVRLVSFQADRIEGEWEILRAKSIENRNIYSKKTQNSSSKSSSTETNTANLNRADVRLHLTSGPGELDICFFSNASQISNTNTENFIERQHLDFNQTISGTITGVAKHSRTITGVTKTTDDKTNILISGKRICSLSNTNRMNLFTPDRFELACFPSSFEKSKNTEKNRRTIKLKEVEYSGGDIFKGSWIQYKENGPPVHGVCTATLRRINPNQYVGGDSSEGLCQDTDFVELVLNQLDNDRWIRSLLNPQSEALLDKLYSRGIPNEHSNMVRSVVNAQAAGIVESRTTSNGNIVKDKGDKIEGNIDLKQGGWKDETISALIRQMSYVVPVRPLVARGVDRRLLILQRLHAEVAEEMLPSETWSKTKKKHTLPYDSVSGSELWLLDGLRLIRPNLLQLTPESMANVLASPLSLRTWRDPRSQDIAFRKAVTNLLFLAWNPYRFSISDIGGERMFHKLKKKKRTIMREASTNSINVLRCLFVLLASAAARAVSAHNRATEEAKQNYLSKINSNPAYTSPKNRKNDEDNHSGKTFKLPLSDDGSDPPHPCCNLIRWLADNLFSRCSIELGAKECKIERLDRSPILELLPIVCDTLSLMCGNGWRWLAISLLPRVVAVTRTLNQLAVKHPGVQHVESVLALKESKRRVRLLSSSSSTGISKNSNALYCWAYFCADNRQLPLPPSSRDWHVLPIDCDAEIEAAWQERQSAEEKNSERLECSKISLTSSLGGYINFRTPISGEFRVVYFNEKFASFGEYKNGRELRRFTGKTALELIAIREVEVGGDIHQDILTNQNSDSKGKESSSALNSVLPKVFRILISLATLGGRQAAGLICGQPETDEEEKLAPWLRSPLFSNGMISCPPPEKKFSHSRLTPLPRSKGRDTPPPPIPSLVGKSSFSRRIISPTNASEKSRFPRPFLFSLANIKDVNYTGNSNHDWEIIQKWLMSYQVLTAREKFLIKKGRYNNFPQCERPFFAALLWHCGQSLCDEVEVSVTSMRHKIPPMYPLSSESTKQNVDASPTRIPSENLQLLWNTVMKLRKHLTSMKQKSLKQKETSVTSDNVQIRPTLFRQVSDEEIATGTALTFDMQCDLYANRAMFLLEVCPVITDIKNNKKNSVDVSHYTPIVPSVIFPNPKQTRNQFKSSAPTKLHAPLPIFTGKLNNKNVSQLDSNWRALSPPSRMPLTIRWHYEVSQKSWGILITVLRARSKFLSTVKRMRLLKKQPFKECSDLNKSNYLPPSGLLNVLGDILIYTKEGFKLGASPRHLRYIIGPNGIRRNRADSRAAGLRGMLQLLRCLSSSAAKQIALLRLRPALMGDVSWVQRIAKEKPVIRNGPVTVAEEKNTELDLREEKVKSVLDIDIPSVTIREMELPGKYHEYQNTPLFIGPGKDSNLSVKSFSSLPPAADSSRVRHYPLKALSGCGKNCRHDVRNAFVELYTHLACAMRKAYEEKDAALGEWICWTWALDFAAEDSEFLLRIGIVPLLEAMADAEAEKPSKMAVKINYSGVAMFHQEWKPWPVEIVRQTIMVGNLSKRELVQHMRAVPSPMQWEKTVDDNSVDLWWKSRPTLLHGSIANAAEIHSIEFLVLAYTSLLQTFEDRQNDIFSSGALTVEEIQEESRARKSAIEYEKRAQKIARKVEKKKEAKCNEQNDTLGLSISTAERFRRCANPLLQLLLVMTTGGRKRDFVSTMPIHKDSFDVSLEGIKYNNSTGVYLANTTNFEVEYSGNIEDSSFCFSLEFERVLFRAIFFQLRSAMRILSPEKHKSNDASNVSEQNTVDDTDSNLVREAEESVFKILRQLLSIADTKGCRLHLGRRILLSQLFKLSLGRFLSESHDTINVSIRIRRLSIKLLAHSLPGLKPREVLASFQEAFPKCKSDVIDVVKCVTVIDEETAAKVVVRYILFALGTALIPPGLSVAAGKIDSLYEKHQSKERHAILNPPKKLLPPVNPESVTIVAAVGFDCETARLALRVCGGNAQQAVEWLLANPIDSKIFNDASKKFPIENDETDSELNTETSFNQDLQTMNNCDSEVSETNQNVTKNEILSEIDIIGNGASCRAASNVLIHLLRIFFKTNVKDVSTSVTIWATAIESELSKSLRDFISEGITADMRKLSSSIADQVDGPYEQKSGTFLSDENTRIETATNKLEDMRNKISLAIASLAVMSTGWETLCVGCRVIVAGGSAGTVLSIQENVLAPMESSVSVLFDNTRVANTMLASKVTPVQEISTPMESLENLSELIINVSSVVLETESACNCNSEDDDTNLNHDESMNFLDKFYAMKHIRSVASLQLAMFRAFSMRALHTVLQTSNGLAIARGCNIIPLLIAEASTASSEPNLNTIQTLEYRNTEVWARILDMTYGNILPIDPPVSRVINDRCLEGKSQDAMNKRRAVASTLMAFAPVQNIELCIKALELKQDNVEMAADWLLTSGVSFLNAGGLDTDRSSQQYDSRFEAGKELAMMFGLPFNLCIKALRLMRDNKEAAADWLLSNGYSFQTGEEKPRAEILPFYFPPRINVENEETPLSESFNSGTESDVEECNASRNDGDSKPNITVSTSSQHKTSSKSFFSIDDMVCTNSFYDFMISVFDSKTSASFENEDIIWDRSRDIEYYYGKVSEIHDEDDGTKSYSIYCEIDGVERRFTRCNLRVLDEATFLHISKYEALIEDPFNIALRRQDERTRIKRNASASDSFEKHQGIDDSTLSELLGEHTLREDETRALIREMDLQQSNIILRNDADNGFPSIAGTQTPLIGCQNYDGEASNNAQLLENDESKVDENNYNLQNFTEDMEFHPVLIPNPGESIQSKINMESVYKDKKTPIPISCVLPGIVVAVPFTSFAENVNPIIYKNDLRWVFAVVVKRPDVVYDMSESTIRICHFDIETSRRSMAEVSLSKIRFIVRLFGKSVSNGTKLLQRCISIEAALSISYSRLCLSRIIVGVKDSIDTTCELDAKHNMNITHGSKAEKYQNLAVKLIDAAKLMSENQEKKEKTKQKYDSSNWIEQLIILVKVFVASQKEFSCESNDTSICRMFQRMSIVGGGDSIGSSTLENQSHTIGSNFNSSCRSCPGRLLPDPSMVMYEFRQVLQTMVATEAFSNNDTSGMKLLLNALLKEATLSLRTSTTPGSVSQKNLLRLTSSSIHPYWPHSDETGEIELDTPGAHWIIFDSRCETLPTATLEFYRDKEHCLLTGVASGPKPWRPVVVTLPTSTVYWKFRARDQPPGQIDNPITGPWGWRFQIRPLKGQRWNSETAALSAPCLEWACWLLELLFRETSTGHKSQVFDALVAYLQARGAPGKQRVTKLLTRLVRSDWCVGDVPNLKLLQPIERSIMSWCMSEQKQGRVFLPQTVQELVGLILAAKEAARHLGLQDNNNDKTKRNRKDIDAKVDKSSESSMKMCSMSSKTKDDNTDSDSEELAGHPRIPGPEDLSGTLLVVSDMCDFLLSDPSYVKANTTNPDSSCVLPVCVLARALRDSMDSQWTKRVWIDYPSIPVWFESMDLSQRHLLHQSFNHVQNITHWIELANFVSLWQCWTIQNDLRFMQGTHVNKGALDRVEFGQANLKNKELSVNNLKLDIKDKWLKIVSVDTEGSETSHHTTAVKYSGRLLFLRKTRSGRGFPLSDAIQWQCSVIKEFDPTTGVVILERDLRIAVGCNTRYVIPFEVEFAKSSKSVSIHQALEFAWYLNCGGTSDCDFSLSPTKMSSVKEQEASLFELNRSLSKKWLRRDPLVCNFLVKCAHEARLCTEAKEQAAKAKRRELYSRLPSMEIRLKEAAKAMSIWTSRMDEELMSLVTQRSVSFEASAISIDRRWGNSERKIPSIFDLQPGCMSRLTEKEKNRFQLLANFPLDQFAEDQGNITEAPYVIRLRFAILRLWNGFVNRVLPLVDLMSIEDTNIEKTFNIRNIPNTTIDSTANEINPSMPLGLKLSRLKSKIFLASKMNMLNTAVYKTRGQIDSFTMSLNNQEAFQSREQSRNDLSARQVETSKCLFAQAVDALASASASSLRGGLKDAQLFKVKFSGEDGVDAGGLYRDTLTAFITDDLFSESSDAPPLLLFIKSPNGRNTEGNFRNCFVPNPQQKSPQSLSAFVVVGRLMGIALRTQHYLPFLLPPPFWTALTGKCNSVGTPFDIGPNTNKHQWHLNAFRDLSSFDFITAQLLQDIYESKPMTEEEFLEIYKDVPYMQNFTINGVWGKSCIRLVSDILSIPVQQSQKLKYVQLALIARLSEFNVQIDAIRRGLFELVPERSIRLLSGEQLQILVCGNTTVDIRVLKKHTLYEGWRGKSNNIFVKRFWRAIEKLNQSERSQFIRFVWGRSRLPRESDWGRPFKLTRRGGGDSTLPVAHTCFFQCEFPEYSSDEKCAAAIQVVIHYGFCGFHIS